MVRALWFSVVLLLGCLVAGSVGDEVRRTYDSDHQHKRSAPKNTRAVPGYEEVETTSEHWWNQAQNTLRSKLDLKASANKAKNVIFFIGDGMSPQTTAATRMYLGNENKKLSFEEFPYLATAKTYCVDRQVADSACTATAYLSGVKTNYGMINVSPSVPRYNCNYNRTEAEFHGLLQWAQEAGKATGVVTTTRITHASPAGAYANIANRDWEDDSGVLGSSCDPTKYPDIAQQLVHGDVGKKVNVFLGGGRKHFIPETATDEENQPGKRKDGRNLINEWKETHPSSQYVWNKAGLKAVDLTKTDYLLGLFENDHCRYNLHIDEHQLNDKEPKLSEMTETAIKMLAGKSKEGFVLFVEGGRIDTAHHESFVKLALEETAEYSRAIALARELTSVEDTLIVVSADHSHTMTYNGYTKRGQNVLGIADISGVDNLPYSTLSYANGEGFYLAYKDGNPAERLDISSYNFDSSDQKYIATVPLSAESHGGEDVDVFASGPGAHLFQGNLEQSVLPHLMAHAAEIGHYRKNEDEDDDDDDAGSSLVVCVQTIVVCLLAAFIKRF
ncbi:alkaline phosphatase-like [Uranotaenia lowii]|uniref:alkaline phosphatase-like n=1 Tax=Uranotaenia lowii TaxID=190385 RepID=UPI00247A0462|nr:alkaline phosphatase-like [Uranotaenia lowii]